MALKLGKCRLCLKLGDFYSIFTMDNALQLSEMAMDCARIKIYEGDGLPDKICSECVQKLSSAYIFKQQCERSDTELRRNYVPPPGFSVTPPPPNRQSSDSAFSSANTDMSYHKPPSIEKVTPVNRPRKRSRESIDESVSSRSHDYNPRPSNSKRVEELRTTNKRPRNHSPNASLDSDYEDTSYSHYSPGTDSDEPLISHKCKQCGKEFKSSMSLRSHMKVHKQKTSLDTDDAVVNIPRKSLEDAKDSEDKLSCEKCHKTFKLKIMLKRHQESCGVAESYPQLSKELIISLEPVDGVISPKKAGDPNKKSDRINCEMCSANFKTYDNMEKHMKYSHAAIPKTPRPIPPKVEMINFPCLYCCVPFDNYTAMAEHFNDCSKRDDTLPLKCPVCHKIMTKRHTFLSHVKQIHFFVVAKQESPTKTYDCRMCDKKLASQDLLISHLASHMSHVEEPAEVPDDDDGSVADDNQSMQSDYTASSSFSNGPYKCDLCDKSYKYKKALETHQAKCTGESHAAGLVEVKTEPPDKPSRSFVYRDTDEEDSPAEGEDLTCDICEKQFSYKRVLDQHKRIKHNMGSGHKRAKITLKDCMVRCLICDVEMKVSTINEHNQKHIAANIKPRNQYTCGECSDKFKSCSALATHIKLVHRLKQPTRQENEQFEVGINNLEVDINNLEVDIGNLEVDIDNLEVDIDNLEVDIDNLEVDIDNLEVDIDNLKVDIDNLEKDIDNLEVDIVNLEVDIVNLDVDIDNSEVEIDNWEVDIDNLKVNIDNLEVDIDNLEVEIVNLDVDIDNLVVDIDNLEVDIDNLEVDIDNWEVDIYNLEVDIVNSEVDIDNLKVDIVNLKVDVNNCADLADFCEVVVTKTEPLDAVQRHNGCVEVPLVDGPLVDMAGFTCHICSKKLKTLISLKRHVNWHANVGNNITKNIECFVCKETFKFQCHYKLHMRAHYTDPNLDPQHLTCQICGRRSKHLRAAQAHMNFHKQTRFKNKDYQCSICKRIFQDRKVYLAHMAIHYKRGEGQNTIVGDRPLTSAMKNLEGGYQCPQCGKVCDSENSLKCHIRWHSSKSALFGSRHECTICGLQFTNKRRLEIHTRDHYEDENGPYKCTICGKGYIDEDYFRRHVKGHNFDHFSHKKRIEKLRKDKVKCPICSRYYPNLIKLIRHLKRSHPESKMIKEDPDAPPPQYHSCKLCTRVFLTELKLKRHQKAHTRKHEFFKCKFCGIKSVSLRKHKLHVKQKHMTTKFFDNPLKCPYCTETYIIGYKLQHHVRDVHGIDENWIADREEEPMGPLKEFQCSVCLKILASKGNYERHIDYHNSLRCNYCFDYFSSTKFLEGHLAFSCDKKKLIGETETYPKKVKCHVCYKAFALQVKVDCHLRTQHGIKVNRESGEDKGEHLCDYCFKVFENGHALAMHKIYHRTIGYYGCIYCDRKFNTYQRFFRHKKDHLLLLNREDPTKCEHCDETFVAFRDMIDHMKEAHGDDKDWVVLPKEVTEDFCTICNKDFYNLPRHMSYHEENRCKKCGEYFLSRTDYDNHLCAIESEDEVKDGDENDIRPKYEECTFCFKPITKTVTKIRHDLLHNTSGAISCRFCTMKFKTLDAFNIHSFSHRSRKYHQNPIKCRICKEKFFRYGPFVKHMKTVHKSKKKMHYRAIVKEERCVVCGDNFPNLHNHYRCHLKNQCLECKKYFNSVKLFKDHRCDKEDADPSKVFTSDEDLYALIKSYVPKDAKDDEKFYGYTDDEEEEEETQSVPETNNEDSQSSMTDVIQQPFVISDVLSLYEKREELLATYMKEDPQKKELNPKKYVGPKSKRPKKESPKKTSPKKDSPKKETASNEEGLKNGNGDAKDDDDDDSDVEVVIMLDDDSNGAENTNNIISIDLDDDDD
ncbi:hypothetical protein O0L34_g8329 [Tuta absoluta]|nr:hypothetical protein O0L34_g8329 [Tuta absoluta]